MYSNYDNHKKAIDLLKIAKKFIVNAHVAAEAKHDSYGEYYMDYSLFEIMESTEKLISEINETIKCFKENNQQP